MEYFSGIIVAVVIATFASIIGFDKDKSFYPVVLIVIAIFYVLFAAMSGGLDTIFSESVIVVIFFIIAIIGFKKTTFVVAFGLIGHGVFDLFHNQLITNASMPVWWPTFCVMVDVVLGIWVLYLSKMRSNISLQSSSGSGG